MIIGLVLIVGAGIWYINASREAAVLSEPLPTEDPLPKIERVSLQDAKAAFDNGSAVFVDVRDAQSYASEHLKGAKSIPLGDIPTRLGELDKNAWIITYCT
jgi:3-mercaptopyruvate sulfurtransferase SseA